MVENCLKPVEAWVTLPLQLLAPSAQKTDFAVQAIKPCIKIAISLGNAIGEKMPQIEIMTVLTKTHTGMRHGGLG